MRTSWKQGAAIGALALGSVLGLRAQAQTTYNVAAFNELGMHCMQNDFSQMMILPPFNSFHAQVIRRGVEPSIVTSGVSVSFEIPTNTHSSDKCNFWVYAPQLLGANLAPDIGLGGFGLSGSMVFDPAHRTFLATGIPLTPVDDDGKESPYSMALVTVKSGTTVLAQTQAVVPVSWEMSCNLCHNTPGVSTATAILTSHDRLHGTSLLQHQPVMCASCHSDNALGAPGQPGVSSMSGAMHTAHGPRMTQINLANECYACHPGIRTNCLRDAHAAAGKTCTDCHGTMAAVGSPTRNPWVDLPRCADCHNTAGHEYEQPGKRFRDSVGHGGVQCMTCHGSPHAIGPAVTDKDNAQMNRLQGHSGTLNTCLVCHTTQPTDPFPHRYEP